MSAQIWRSAGLTASFCFCMNSLHSAKQSDAKRTSSISLSVPQDRLGNNGATSSTPDSTTLSTAGPLERQNASFGSFDFLKLLETGPNGKSSLQFWEFLLRSAKTLSFALGEVTAQPAMNAESPQRNYLDVPSLQAEDARAIIPSNVDS